MTSKRSRIQAHAADAQHVAAHVRIRKSRIPSAGGGAFTSVPIAAGKCLGFYAGARANAGVKYRDYVMSGGESGGRDGHDPDGRLVLASGEVVDVHGWTNRDWAQLACDGVAWDGRTANWTRFMNHASSAFQNVCLCTTSERFGRSHAFYAKRRIAAGEELYFSYGADYFRARGYAPQDPSPA